MTKHFLSFIHSFVHFLVYVSNNFFLGPYRESTFLILRVASEDLLLKIKGCFLFLLGRIMVCEVEGTKYMPLLKEELKRSGRGHLFSSRP